MIILGEVSSRLKSPHGNSLIVKSNYLIESSYRLTITEQRLLCELLAMIEPTDTEFYPYRIKLSDLAAAIGIDSKNIYSDVKNITSDLLKRVITIRRDNKSILQVHWLSSAEYIIGEGIVEFCFDPKLKPYLLQLKDRFTKTQLKNVRKFKNMYALRFYELLKQHEKFGERTIPLSKMREFLDLEEGQYRLYGDIKKRILTPCRKEINEKTDITYDFEEIKTGKSVTSIRFIIRSNSVQAIRNEYKAKPRRTQLDLKAIVAEQADLFAINELAATTTESKRLAKADCPNCNGTGSIVRKVGETDQIVAYPCDCWYHPTKK